MAAPLRGRTALVDARSGVQPVRPEESAIACSLVCRIYRGDAAAESELVQRYGPSVIRMLRALSRNRSALDDIYQETFATVIVRLRRAPLERPEALASFVRGTARNLLIVCNRRRRMREALEVDADLAGDVEDPQPGQLTRVLTEEKSRLVRRAIAGMRSPRYRQLLVRFYLDGDPKETICADLGMTEVHFHRVLFRARRRFLGEMNRRFWSVSKHT